MKIHFYSDGGHGWAKVKRELIVKLQIEDQISSYSYQRGDYVYLEEDCDLANFVNKLNAINEKVEFIEHHTNKSSKIRSYERYKK